MGAGSSRDEEEEIGALEAFVERLKLTLDVSTLSENVANFVKQKLDELQSLLTQKIGEAGAGAIENEEETFEELLEASEKEIKEQVAEMQQEIEEKIEEEIHKSGNDKIEKIMEQLQELLRDYNTIAVQRKTWQTINDLDTLHESTGLYVIESQPGYFKDNKNPACKMLKVIPCLIDAITEEDKSRRLSHLMSANEQFETAWWAGIDPNTNEIKNGFLELRRDAHAYSHDSYNERLGEISMQAERLHDEAEKDDSISRNIFSAIKYITLICSQPGTNPLMVGVEEQKICVGKARSAINYAVAKQKRVR